MQRIFTPGSPYKKQARFLAILWTLLIFVGCLTPGSEIPKVDLPFIDKWTHLVLFGVFTFLWLCARPVINFLRLFTLALISIVLGSLIEVLQDVLSFLGRSSELMDAIADGVGGIIGIGLFCLCAYLTRNPRSELV